jgi:hypothetical protein
MSEPKSTGEIEDVLSSIRRLVSEDLRPAARQPAAPPPPREVGEKLMLTPALRVVRDDIPPVAHAPEVPPQSAAAAFQSVRSAPAADAVAALGAAMGQRGVQDESGDEDLPANHARWDAEEAGFIDVDHAAETADPVDVAAAPPRIEADEAWTGALAEDDAIVGQAAHEAEDWVPETEPSEDRLDPHWQAEEAEVITSAAPQGTWADAATAEVLRELSEEAEAEAVFGRIDEPADAVYDEELLRELVRDIIREELQGALGERITRNVRKLVRAEIARALAVRDFE